MTFSLILMTALAQPPAETAAPGGLPPEQAVAIIDGEGKLRITQVSFPCGYGAGASEAESAVLVKRGADKVPVKVKVNSLILTTTELPASVVDAYTVDGKPIAPDKLATMLAKERTVLVAKDGRKIDAFHLDLYKEGTIVLVPPANTLRAGAGAYDSPNYGRGPETVPTIRETPEKPKNEEPHSDK
jgi:hypothetical protein